MDRAEGLSRLRIVLADAWGIADAMDAHERNLPDPAFGRFDLVPRSTSPIDTTAEAEAAEPSPEAIWHEMTQEDALRQATAAFARGQSAEAIVDGEPDTLQAEAPARDALGLDESDPDGDRPDAGLSVLIVACLAMLTILIFVITGLMLGLLWLLGGL